MAVPGPTMMLTMLLVAAVEYWAINQEVSAVDVLAAGFEMEELVLPISQQHYCRQQRMYLRVIGFDLSLRLPLRLSSLLMMSVRPCDDDATTVAVVVAVAVDGKNLVGTILGDADDGGDDAVAVDA